MIAIPPTTTHGHVHDALDFVMKHIPEALSEAGRELHDAEVARIRDRDARHHATYAALQADALRRAGRT